MYLIPVPAFADNYLWLLHDGKRALVVDPGDAEPIERALEQHALQLESILVTHHHADHTGGVDALREATGAKVYGPAKELIPGPFTALQGGNTVHALGLDFQVLDLPGHTAGHIAYYAQDVDGKPLLFCGDTLFSGGCGRLFEGTPAQMLNSLDQLAALPGHTVVCCTHEYTLSNLRFAMTVEPSNADLVTYQAHCMRLREENQPTLPTSIAQERLINPFLRTRQATIMAAAHRFDATAQDDNTVFAAIRQWKNQYK
ncbi:hydroxyacylglutathione hydrolase [Polaromonas sp. OV174]|uniref:hydroxyacylglutathione hydrolase n=1 Tax=Polaromonas sp. OV174 TaxID=1855300 RepID=UPI0008E31F1A|nr:hydroxyacylglutathione hydrolase [Polaromonas sp. OV174]SFC36574.1 hydroxyacylglutathione hydrolase [Polaromonas sp. OV174]